MTIQELVEKLNAVAAVIGADSDVSFRAGGCQWELGDVTLEGDASQQRAVIEG